MTWPRGHPTVIGAGDVIYVLGGSSHIPDPYTTRRSTVEIYSPSLDQWTEAAPLPRARVGGVGAEIDGRLFVIGGSTSGSRYTRDGVSWEDNSTDSLDVYDLAIASWSRGATMPTERTWAAGAAFGGKLYVIGGWEFDLQTALSTVEVYDPTTDTWSERAPMPTPRYGLAAAVVDGKIYAVGGKRDNSGSIATLEVYDPALDTWESRAPMWAANNNSPLVAINGKLYTFGSDGRGRTVQEYDPDTDRWRWLGDAPSGRVGGAGAVVVDGTVYVVGGWSLGPRGDLDVFVP